ncbi:hypothetical protein JTE90_015728 [Oedothorax gibbosus]|uniref:Reverse transcriptase domain-containing protein n=1 Tax=Oedothorax gibbosus TaxID=931172 RepID=A0AAV6U0E6_9ARAC|nr:hypothetical protein JTE90_015728 [Oedothorax gibbosus]
MWAEDSTISNMNQLLLACFGQERTLESIKGKRRSLAYRILVDAEKTKLMTVRPYRPRRNVARGHPNDGPEADEDNPVVEPGRDVDSEDDSTVIYSWAPESVDAEDQVSEGDTTICYNWSVDYVALVDASSEGNTVSAKEDICVNTALAILDIEPELALKLTEDYLMRTVAVDALESFDRVQKKKRKNRVGRKQKEISKRKLRKLEYARMQDLYKKTRSECYEKIFSRASIGDKLCSEDTFEFWKHLLKDDIRKPNVELLRATKPVALPDTSLLLEPILIDEVVTSRIPFRSSPGPDNVTPKAWNRVPVRVKAKLFTVWIKLAKVPNFIVESKTIFLPKKEETISPSDLRPVSIASVILRHFNKVLARRMSTIMGEHFDIFQLGFRPFDGIAQGLSTLNDILKCVGSNQQGLALASVDIQKAFDSVDHGAIFEALEELCFPEEFIRYIRFIYQEAKTKLLFKGDVSEPIHPARGVRQGDPLSPLLFLIVFDHVLRSIPPNEGFMLGDKLISHLAYADDLIIATNSKRSLQRIFDAILPTLGATGLEINLDKSFTLTWVKDDKRKRMLFDCSEAVYVRNRPLKALDVVDNFTYLGVRFNSKGRLSIKSELGSKLETLLKAPLKPQQKYFLLLKMLIPGVMHELTFSQLHAGSLKKLDLLLRKRVRAMLHLPHDTPIAAFHATTYDGGLGLPSLRWTVPLLAAKRGAYKKTQLLMNSGKIVGNNGDIHRLYRNRLLESCDVAGLKEANKVPSAHAWITDGTALMSGRKFVQAVQIRLNVLYSRGRAARGRSMDHQCTRGCPQPETLNHILQVCYATHKLRIKRHDDVANYLNRGLSQRGFTVHSEPMFETSKGTLKPGLVIYSEDEVTVCDIQVVNDQFPLITAHRNKYEKYEPLVEKLANLRSKFSITSLTMNWRGILCRKSVEDLLIRKMISTRDLKLFAVKVLEGGAMAHQVHQNMTACLRTVKKGEG